MAYRSLLVTEWKRLLDEMDPQSEVKRLVDGGSAEARFVLCLNQVGKSTATVAEKSFEVHYTHSQNMKISNTNCTIFFGYPDNAFTTTKICFQKIQYNDRLYELELLADTDFLVTALANYVIEVANAFDMPPSKVVDAVQRCRAVGAQDGENSESEWELMPHNADYHCQAYIADSCLREVKLSDLKPDEHVERFLRDPSKYTSGSIRVIEKGRRWRDEGDNDTRFPYKIHLREASHEYNLYHGISTTCLLNTEIKVTCTVRNKQFRVVYYLDHHEKPHDFRTYCEDIEEMVRTLSGRNAVKKMKNMLEKLRASVDNRTDVGDDQSMVDDPYNRNNPTSTNTVPEGLVPLAFLESIRPQTRHPLDERALSLLPPP